MANERKELRIVAPSDARPGFANITQVVVSDESVFLQFACLRPGAASGQLVSEIILTPKQAIEFNRALDATIKKHFTRHLGANT